MKKQIEKLINKTNLTEEEMIEAMNEVMNGQASEVELASFLTALRMKGETIAEITGGARVMREKASSIKINHNYAVDTCGTGGDSHNTYNISTTVSFILAAGGVPVVKHGNRAVSSKSGSADVLEALGINLGLNPSQVGKCVDEIGIGFLFAPTFHGAMKHAIGVRRALGFRTVFNMLGPLTNPAEAKGQILGVFNKDLTEVFASVLKNLGTERALVVHGFDGMDEISISDKTQISELKDGEIKVAPIEDYNPYRWREGIISFKDATFPYIIHKFEKYYGVEIRIENKAVMNYRCTGKFRHSDGVRYALRVLQKDVDFQFVRDEENHIIYIK